tara:strand:- start:183 stop:455 length:273 start_codon:yes stop_codon:yes gene_type:complete
MASKKYKETLTIDLAVYMERLDTYISTQNSLNETLCRGLDKVNDELEDLRAWRSKMYGAKAMAVFTGILFAHATVVLGAVLGIIRLRLGV